MHMYSLLKMVALTVLQWNAQGMFNHGPQLLKYLDMHTHETFHLICIQETWFRADMILQIPQYTCFQRNRENQLRGGCAIIIRS